MPEIKQNFIYAGKFSTLVDSENSLGTGEGAEKAYELNGWSIDNKNLEIVEIKSNDVTNELTFFTPRKDFIANDEYGSRDTISYTTHNGSVSGVKPDATLSVILEVTLSDGKVKDNVYAYLVQMKNRDVFFTEDSSNNNSLDGLIIKNIKIKSIFRSEKGYSTSLNVENTSIEPLAVEPPPPTEPSPPPTEPSSPPPPTEPSPPPTEPSPSPSGPSLSPALPVQPSLPAPPPTELPPTTNPSVVCFTRGTRMSLGNGADVAVEYLCSGDSLMTLDHGSQKIHWISKTKVERSLLEKYNNLLPIRIEAGALGDSLPKRDLFISKQHRILLNSNIIERVFDTPEVLIPIKDLTSHPSINVTNCEDYEDGVEYYHIFMGQHEILLAEGAPAESLFLGEETYNILTIEELNEILSIISSHLEGEIPCCDPVRPLKRGVKVKNLIQRHIKNSKSLIDDSVFSKFKDTQN